MLQSRKRLRIFFKKLEFHVFRNLGWRLVRGWKVQLWGVHRDFRGSVRDSLASGTSICEKHLENFFKSFLSSVLAACPSDLHATYVSRENRMFCTKWVSFLNFFSFPSNISDCSSPSLPEHSQTHRISLKQTSILNHIILKSSRKKV